ncbi:putative deleted in malignant brain tumors 1 protein-like [Apostichopus japonicus]|uniref:Putative deleted in malignant brain tumors 1 protein-like n=2 Tax=Stichopus japonicus TaxID=307972 RepID=A0A2G8KRZ2_STIJA|nr:putative deleted in malignant brain tumors 1 protein-like [Apostichopus japonicus]
MNGAWGTICDDSWDMADANVACRQLGYTAAEAANSSASYGEGIGQIWLDDVVCSGSEEHILACGNRGVGEHNCGHHEDAGVRCAPPVRLVSGRGSYEGRVEVFMKGEWGTIDEDPWDDNDATVVCRQLGFPFGGVGFKGAHFGQGTGPIWIDDVNCEGQEANLLHCSHNTDTREDSHAEDVGVACNGPLRLVGGEGNYQGRVELFMKGEWGTVDEDPWEDIDAGVVCRELGFHYGGIGYKGAHFGQGTGPIWIDNVNCHSEEAKLIQCPYQTDTREDSHAEDVGVSCNGPLRLVGGANNNEGRVEIFINGTWGTICDDYWDNDDANVACRQLGYSSAEAATSSASYGQGTGQIWLDDVQCDGSEQNILSCANRGVGVHNCGHSEDAGVRCEF